MKKIKEVKVGDRFHLLEVQELYTEKIKDRTIRIAKCKCDCGKTKPIRVTNLLGTTKSCGCVKKAYDNCREKHGKWKGYKDITGYVISHIKYDAERRGLVFDLSAQDIYEIYEKQNKLCALSNIPIKFCTSKEIRVYKIKPTASIDRINNLLGYTKDNIQIIHKDLNWLKASWDQTTFIILCNLVAKVNPIDNIDSIEYDEIVQRRQHRSVSNKEARSKAKEIV